MKKSFYTHIIMYVLLMCFISCSKQKDIMEGDLIFQISRSSQSKAIQAAAKSKYSHMGMIFFKNGKHYVLEAVEPVKYTLLQDWINRGENGHYVVKRLKNANTILNEINIKEMKSEGEKFLNRHYDIYFEWSDERIYCSELVWKIYERILGIEIGALAELGSFDLTNSAVKSKLKERYGDNIPLKEKVISPVAMYESEKLIKVMEK